MFKMDLDKFFDYLNKGSDFEIVINGKTASIQPKIRYAFNSNDMTAIAKMEGYLLDKSTQYNTLEELKNYIIENNITDYIFINKINGFESEEDYLEDLELYDADMKYLLDKYSDCNYFSLTSDFNDSFYLSEENEKEIFNELVNDNYKTLKKLYNKYKDEYKLEDFDILYSEIKKECLEFESKHKNDYKDEIMKYGEGYFSNSFICSHIGKDTKYNEPIGLFWHFYHELGMELDSKVRLRKIIEMNNKMDVLTILDKYPILKNEYINHKISFLSHCTKGPLQITFFFKLNNNTKKWLLEFENDYKLELPLQDLAFYKDDKIRFSSCTHERFHSNIK